MIIFHKSFHTQPPTEQIPLLNCVFGKLTFLTCYHVPLCMLCNLIWYSWIPGYFVSIVAGVWPAVAKSLVLINTAGNVVPQYSSVPFSQVRGLDDASGLPIQLLSKIIHKYFVFLLAIYFQLSYSCSCICYVYTSYLTCLQYICLEIM